MGEGRDDERSGTRYNVNLICSTILLIIFLRLLGYLVFVVPRHLRYWFYVCRYAAYRLVRFTRCLVCIIADRPSRNVVSKNPISGPVDPDADVYIGRSEVAMWMRVVSSWVCMLLYIWSLVAPVVLPDR